MSHCERLVAWFKSRDGQATLGEILGSGEGWSYEFRARATDLRKKGYVITCERGRRPSENLYRVIEPEANGQLRLVA